MPWGNYFHHYFLQPNLKAISNQIILSVNCFHLLCGVFQSGYKKQWFYAKALTRILKVTGALKLTDHGIVLWEQAFINSFRESFEPVQYTACLSITGAIRETFKLEIYRELGSECLQFKRWVRKALSHSQVFQKWTSCIPFLISFV